MLPYLGISNRNLNGHSAFNSLRPAARLTTSLATPAARPATSLVARPPKLTSRINPRGAIWSPFGGGKIPKGLWGRVPRN